MSVQAKRPASHNLLIVLSGLLCVAFFALSILGAERGQAMGNTTGLFISIYYLLATIVMLFRFKPGMILFLLPLAVLVGKSFIL